MGCKGVYITRTCFHDVYEPVVYWSKLAYQWKASGSDCMHMLAPVKSLFFLSFKEKESSMLQYREQLFEERRSHIRQACAQHIQEPTPLHNMFSKLAIAEKHKIIYCGIPKTGSTFWRRTLKIVENEGQFSSLYEYRNSDAKLQRKVAKAKTLIEDNQISFTSFLQEALSFMFVREPYGRIFSAYNNKIFNPNYMFWHGIGRNVVKTVRKNPSVDSLKYGHDVTFPEMVEFLVTRFEQGQGIDQHWSPMFKRCDPCKIAYDYIGKMESFADDCHFLIAKLRQKYRDVYISFGDADTESALDTAQGHVNFLYGILKATKELSYPKYNFFLRTWRDLQIRGYLSKHIDMPMTREQASKITSEDFFSLIKIALEQPMNRTAVKLQRHEAMVQAYQKVSLANMERLAKYVEMDCLLFGYDLRPNELFQGNNDPDKNSFNYFDAI